MTIRLREHVHSDIHTLAEEMGFHRVRVDRSQYKDGPWIEVGYASEEIHIRTSAPNLRYRKRWDKVEMDEVVDLLEALLGSAEEPS